MGGVTATEHDHHRTRPSWFGPVVVAAAGVAGCAFVGLRNPATGTPLLPCPFHAATGLWCPGCGMTRGLHKLLNGDALGALGSNLFLPMALALGTWLWLSWLWPSVGRGRLPGPSRLAPPVWIGVVVALVVYGVARNLPGLDALAP